MVGTNLFLAEVLLRMRCADGVHIDPSGRPRPGPRSRAAPIVTQECSQWCGLRVESAVSARFGVCGIYMVFWALVSGRADGNFDLQDDPPFPFWEVRRLARFGWKYSC